MHGSALVLKLLVANDVNWLVAISFSSAATKVDKLLEPLENTEMILSNLSVQQAGG